MHIQQRLQIFFDRLQQAPACRTAEESMALVCRLIEEVEDEFSPVPREEPPPYFFSGRMYAPQQDRVEESSGLLVASTRHHRIQCAADGSIQIVHVLRRKTVLEKKGAIDEYPR